MRYSLVLFDVGETLIGPRGSFGALYSQVLSGMGLDLSEELLERSLRTVWADLERSVPAGTDRYAHFPGGEREYWRQIVKRTVETASGESPGDRFLFDALDRLRDAFRGTTAWRVYPDVTPALRELRSVGARLGVVSNWDSRLPRLLRTLGLSDYFDSIGVSHLEGVEKPDPTLFLRVLDRLGGRPEQALHVGDLPRVDLAGARAAGIDGVLVDRHGALDGSYPALRDLRALPEIARGRLPLPESGAAHPSAGRCGGTRRPEAESWRLRIWGQVEQPVEWNLEELERLPRAEWSASGERQTETRWSGVATREILGRVQLKPDAAFVLVHGKTDDESLSIHEFASSGALLALDRDGRPLTAEQGWPLRLIVPRRGARFSVKGVDGLEFLNKNWPGTR